MKTSLRSLILLSSFFPLVSHAELKLNNTGFEKGSDAHAEHWGSFGEAVERQDFAAKSGAVGVWFKSFAGKNTGGIYQKAQGKPKVGEIYTFDGYFCKEPNAHLKKLEMKLEFFDAQGKLISAKSNDITAGINASEKTFAKFQVTGKVPDGTEILGVAVFFESDQPAGENAASLFFDDASLHTASDTAKEEAEVISQKGIGLRNTSFENGNEGGAEPWVGFGQVLIHKDFAAKSGKAGVWLQSYAENNAGGFYQDAVGKPKPGESYTFSGYFKKETHARLKKVEMKIEFFDSQGKRIFTEAKNITDEVNANQGKFTQHKVTGKTPINSQKIRVTIFYEAGKPTAKDAASLFFDDAALALSTSSTP